MVEHRFYMAIAAVQFCHGLPIMHGWQSGRMQRIANPYRKTRRFKSDPVLQQKETNL